MSSPPPDNILLDPISELERALRAHTFGLDSLSHVIVDASFPRTAGEREDVASEARATKNTPERVVGRAKLVLLNNEGSAEVVLDQRGYSVENNTATAPLDRNTFESFDALLIAISPAYVQAMQEALMARFAQGAEEPRQYHELAEEDEPKWID